MRFESLTTLLAAAVFAVGCASTSSDSASKGDNTMSVSSESCPMCASGEACPKCAAGEACPKCAAEGMITCAECKDGETCAACKAAKAEQNERASEAPAASEGQVATISAKGMGCPLCASSADRRLKKLDGVEWVNIDLGSGQVQVGLAESGQTPTDEELKTAIRDAGFTAETVQMPERKEQP